MMLYLRTMIPIGISPYDQTLTILLDITNNHFKNKSKI
jgi:hypothetical protein